MPLSTAPNEMKPDALTGTANDYLRSRWDDALAAKMDPVQRLIYRSNILGADARITNTGGGNTSAKIDVKDPLTGETTRVYPKRVSACETCASAAANCPRADETFCKAAAA